MIEERLKKGDTFLDIGTGTGILSIIALRLGAKKALAIDIDPASVKTAKMNFGINSIINAEVFLGELKDIPNLLFPNEFKAPFKFDVIAANIVSDVIIDLAFEIKKYLSKGGSLICSGIIKERENDVKIALIKAGFSNLVSITKNEWTAITADA
jgi:ribosomal protein L11 methyltransferase